ncbi:MAG: hypothetical protein H0U74_16815 [Bradymonadaceae bacterium]|nr:hypothetical protein [Lujinxingiaceae bacterium]
MTILYAQRLRRIFLAALAVVLLFSGLSCGDHGDEPYHPPVGEGPWILVDLYHTRIQNPEDYRLTKGNYAYQGVFGFHRLFEHLRVHDYKWTSIREMPLSKPRLSGFDVLFINLVHEGRPDFSSDEIVAIQEFVYNGGGLFIIADHTNVYRHAERVNPIIAPMGLEILFHTAVDFPPQFSVGGNGWIMMFDFAEHAVTAGVDMISFQTGGAMHAWENPAIVIDGAPLAQGGEGVAFTSDRSFADLWNEEETSGFYGDWLWNADATAEPKGPLNGVVTGRYGAGRIAIAGDQNMFGDAWLHFGNNFELALNIFEWTAQQETTGDLRLRDTKPVGLDIGLDASRNSYNTGRVAADGYYTFFVHANRDTDVTARATTRLENHHDALILLSPTSDYSPAEIAIIGGYLESGRRVVITFEAESIHASTAKLVEALAPDFSVSARGESATITQGAAAFHALDIERINAPLTLQSQKLMVSDIELATATGSRDQPPTNRYLLDVTSSWGEPLLTASSGTVSVDIARSKLVGQGELIIFLQDGFFRNRTMGYKETEAPRAHSTASVKLQYKFLDYLKKPSE